MGSPRGWQLTPAHPLALQIAADVRISKTDYTDDQSWELVLGSVDSAALALQTRYGGRVGLASFVPMWWVDGQPIYQYQAYALPPTITAFAPAYVEAQARITPRLALKADHWVIDSHAVGVRYTVKNLSRQPIDVLFDLIPFLAAGGKELKATPIKRNGTPAGISLGALGRSTPLIVLEGGSPSAEAGSTKLSMSTRIQANGSLAIRWLHLGDESAAAGFIRADALFKLNWMSAIRRIVQQADPIPRIETGDADADAAISFAYQQLMQGFMRSTARFAHPSFVAARQPTWGYSAAGDGSDHPRAWKGQTPPLTYLTALAAAPINPALAQGLVRNYLSIQREDGWIDWRASLNGQKDDLLCLPILCRLTWALYRITGDAAFLREMFPGLARFLNRWLRPDHDQDADGLPEWQSEQQTGFPYMPTFAVGLGYGQNLDIRTVEAPDLAAYLLSEALHLQQIAAELGDARLADKLPGVIDKLGAQLDALWFGDRYAYRDRDTHLSQAGSALLEEGRGDEEHLVVHTFEQPQRLIVIVTGGVDHVPRLSVTLQGRGADGQPRTEKLGDSAFAWSNGRGVCTSGVVYTALDSVRAEGLSRVYKISVRTADHQRRDMGSLLPLWAGSLSAERTAALVGQLTDPMHFWLPNGTAMLSAQDKAFNAIKTGEGGGIWGYWVTLMGEALVVGGQRQAAADLLKRVMAVQVHALKAQRAFSEFYHTSEPTPLGERGHLHGIVPLHLLHTVLGVWIRSRREVRIDGAFVWGQPYTITAYDVNVKRDAQHTVITFPSQYTVTLPADAPPQHVIDPTETRPKSASSKDAP
ncbi:MAG: hypothetical protein SF162_03260 [bacterium]|nr:hypothetical protein [bacterium]